MEGGGGARKGKVTLLCPSQKSMVRISPNSIRIIDRARGQIHVEIITGPHGGPRAGSQGQNCIRFNINISKCS